MAIWHFSDSGVSTLAQKVNAFTVGNDHLLDGQLLPFDLMASKVHVRALGKMDLLDKAEIEQLLKGLEEIENLHRQGGFQIGQAQEDGHTAIEDYLTAHCGEIGKKIHTARSRNDQVLTMLRLWQKQQLHEVRESAISLADAFSAFGGQNRSIEMPGYTHLQRAMPTSVGDWAESFAEMLEHCLPQLDAALTNIDRCPLGTAAGYGSGFDYPREWAARELGFKTALRIPNTAQSSRLKIDLDMLYAFVRIGQVLRHFAEELLLFTTREFGFFSMHPDLTTGSSIMPQKRNLDPCELLRGRYALLWGNFCALQQLALSPSSGYHRDFQLGKRPLLESSAQIQEMLEMTELIIGHITPDKARLASACTPELYAVSRVEELIKAGVPFREAYRQIKAELFAEKEQ